MTKYEPLTDLQWEKLKDLFPAPAKRGRGKPHTPWRSVVNSILYVLLTKAKWGTWPKTEEFASKSAAHRWFLHWENSGKLEQVLTIVRETKPDCSISHPKRRFHMPEIEMEVDIPIFLEMEASEQPALSGTN